MGRATLGILLRRLSDARVTVFDRSEESLGRAKEIAGDRAEARVFDAMTESPDLSSTDVVMNFAGPFFGGNDVVASAAVAAGCRYVDICDDIEGAKPILEL